MRRFNKIREAIVGAYDYDDQSFNNSVRHSRQMTRTSPASTACSMSMTFSGSSEEGARDFDASRGESNRVRGLADITNWASVEPVQVTEKAPGQKFRHLPNWSALELPFRPIEAAMTDTSDGQFSPSWGNQSDVSKLGNLEDQEAESQSEGVALPLPESDCRARDTATRRLTAYPQEVVIREDLEERLLSIFDLGHFERFLLNPESRGVFRAWLIESSVLYGSDVGSSVASSQSLPRNVITLDQWMDESFGSDLTEKLRIHSQALLDIYYREDGSSSSALRSTAVTRNFIDAVQLASSQNIFEESRHWLLESLYEQDFKRFITSRLVDVCKAKLGSITTEKDHSGLGDSFVLTNPRFKDNPIVTVSPGFAAITGYEPGTIIGRNCRFLQGPRTCPKAIQRVRNALRAGDSCVELLLNYRSDGTPFQCLLSILPLFDKTGVLTYFVGGQVNITGEIEACSDFSDFAHSISGTSGTTTEPLKDLSPSPTMKRYLVEYSIENSKNHESLASGKVSSTQYPHTSIASSVGKPSANKRSAFEWLTRRIKQEEVITLEFNRPTTAFSPSTVNFVSHMRAFQSSYSRLLIFKRTWREIVFVTPEALEFLGFPTRTRSELNSSALIHVDFFDLVEASEFNRKTKNLKASLKKVIENGTAASFQCNLTWKYIPSAVKRGILKKAKKVTVTRNCVIHLTPLIDCSSKCTSYLAVLG